MKKLFALLCSAFLFSSGSVAAFEETVDFCELSQYGLATYSANFTETAPVPDGIIHPGEYTSHTSATVGEGIHLVSFGSYGGSREFCCGADTVSSAALNSAKQETYLSYDRQYVYVGVRLFLSELSAFSPIHHSVAGDGYSISLSFGLNPSEDPIVRTSYLTNQYFFDPTTLSCTGVIGARVLQSRLSPPSMVMQISSWAKEDSLGYCDAQGTLFNGEKYASLAKLSISNTANGGEVVLEAVLSVGDILQTVHPQFRDTVLRQLETEEGLICGSFLSQFLLKRTVQGSFGATPLCISTCLAGESPFPHGKDALTWKEWIAENYPASSGGNGIVEAIPSPVIFSFSKDTPSVPSEGTNPAPTPLPETGEGSGETVTPPQTIPPETIPPETVPPETEVTPPPDSSEKEAPDQGEDWLDSLPPADYEFPESEEILITKEEDGEEEGSLFGNWVSLAAGILLFASTLLLLLFFTREKEEDSFGKKRQKSKSKKNTQSKKR